MTPLTESEKAACERALVDLVNGASGVDAVLLASPDGFEVVSATRAQSLDGPRLAAMSSSMLALGDAMARDFKLDGCRNVHIEAGDGVVLLLTVPCERAELVLSALASKGSTLGMVLVAARRCAQSIGPLLDGGVPAGKGAHEAVAP
jgi:predicted regulator of Ras-like GTPase activity (Roadblock/LC7/MglB family)